HVLEREVLQEQVGRLNLYNRHLGTLAETLNSRVAELLGCKRRLAGERQRSEEALARLHRCLPAAPPGCPPRLSMAAPPPPLSLAARAARLPTTASSGSSAQQHGH
ncbi:unnamed protein product, partial [Lampetra planeri]